MLFGKTIYMSALTIVLVSKSLTLVAARGLSITKFQIPEEHRMNKLSSKTKEMKPEFCNGLDCPDFKVIHKTDVFEERLYSKSSWVSTGLLNIDFDVAQNKMFQKLFKYISGENTKKEKIKMTAPVINRIIPGAGPACENNFTMSFYMSPTVQDPPQADDKTVYLSSLPEMTVFVKSFGGYATQSSWLENAEALANALSNAGKDFNKNYFYAAGYDSPFKPFDRHNEVWYMGNV